MSSATIVTFQKHIFSWYKKHKRELPWRSTRDPYCILVSEIMSQQTQITRVVPKYLAWMKEFPTIDSLAKANTKNILALWSGLGYNRRALYLQACAQKIVHDYQGVFPKDEKTLRSLPGIGEYTASAILCFAFNKQIIVIDTNVTKVITIHVANGIVPDKKELKRLAEKLLPKDRAYEWNQALMDYAAGELKKEKIPIPKQSTFKNSNRYFRGQVIKYLLANTVVSEKELLAFFSFAIGSKKLQAILASLQKDKLLVEKQKKHYTLV